MYEPDFDDEDDVATEKRIAITSDQDDPLSPTRVDLTFEYEAERMVGMIANRVAEIVANKIEAAVKKEAVDRLSIKVDERITEIVDSAFDRSFQPVDEWGEPTNAKPMAIKDMIRQRADSFMTEKVDSEGKTGGYSANTYRYEYVTRKIVAETLSHQMKTEVEKAAKEARQSIHAKVGEMIAAVVTTGK